LFLTRPVVPHDGLAILCDAKRLLHFCGSLRPKDKGAQRVYPLLTMLAHHVPIGLGAQAMKYDHDQMLMVRAELYDLCEALRMTAFDANPVQFLLRLEQIRATASYHGLTAIAEIASTFEDALQRVQGTGHSVVENFSAILDDAIGIAHVHPRASEALLASVAIRLG
jgi:hypothetical protein